MLPKTKMAIPAWSSTPAHYRGDLVRPISGAIVRLNQTKKQHPILICDEAQLLGHPALEQLPLLLNFDMDSSRYLTLLLVGQPLLRRTLSLQMHEPLRQRIAVQYHLEGLSREELDTYLTHQLKAAGVSQPLFDDIARQALYQGTKGILRKVNKLVLTALRLAASRKESNIGESILPRNFPLVQELGLEDALNRVPHLHKFGAEFGMGDDHNTTRFFFDSALIPGSRTFNIERSLFDKMLMDEARAAGAEIRENTAVKQILKLTNGD